MKKFDEIKDYMDNKQFLKDKGLMTYIDSLSDELRKTRVVVSKMLHIQTDQLVGDNLAAS